MALKSFSEVQQFLTNVLKQNGQLPVSGPHKEFWNTMTHAQFISGNVPGITDNIRILVVGKSQESNIVLALQGRGPLFDPNIGRFGQMPANGPPFFTAEQIAELADWIDAGCPQ
jgi:hypothetical protein